MKAVFFTDRDLGERIFPEMLRLAGIAVERHVDHFHAAAPDEQWIPKVAMRRWYALSNDRRIYRNDTQRQLVIESGLGLFVLSCGHCTSEDLARNFTNTYGVVERFIGKHQRPFIASITRPQIPTATGNVNLLYPRISRT